MIKTNFSFVFPVLVLLLAINSVAAQQAPHVCGSGPGPNEVMAGVQPGGGGMAPTPLCYWKSEQQQSAPAVRWADRWGAIAVSGNSVVGVSEDQKSKRGAQTTAMTDCKTRGGTGCEVLIAYYNQCAALVVSGRYATAAREELKEMAISSATRDCKSKNGDSCRVYYSGCSLPVRTR